MQNEALNQLMAEIAEKRRQQQENCQQLRQSAFTFNTGLLKVKRELEETSERFCMLTGRPDKAYRRAS